MTLLLAHWWWKASLVTLLLGVSISDAKDRRVDNLLNGALLLFACAFWLVHAGIAAWWVPVVGCVGAFSLLVGPYALGLVGAGDVKVFAACGAVAGVSQLGTLSTWCLLSTGLLSLCYLAIWSTPTPLALFVRLGDPRGALQRGRLTGETLPLAVALSAGLLLSLKGNAAWQL